MIVNRIIYSVFSGPGGTWFKKKKKAPCPVFNSALPASAVAYKQARSFTSFLLVCLFVTPVHLPWVSNSRATCLVPAFTVDTNSLPYREALLIVNVSNEVREGTQTKYLLPWPGIGNKSPLGRKDAINPKQNRKQKYGSISAQPVSPAMPS